MEDDPRIASFVRRGLEAEGYRITANHGPHGGQLVLHFHVHITGGRQMSHRMGNMPRAGDKEGGTE